MRTTRRWSVIAFLAIATVMAAMFGAGSASAAPARPGYTQPAYASSPSSGPVGTSVTVTGDLMTPGASGTITFNSEPTDVASFTVGADGKFSATFDVPQGKAVGDHTIVAADGVDTPSNLGFRVTAGGSGQGGVTVTNPTPAPGEAITVSGTSCTAGTTVTVSLDGTPLATGTADSGGNYSIPVTIPAGTSTGSHTLSVSGAGSNCSGVMDITVTAGGNNGGGGLANTGVAVIGIGSLGVVLLIGGGLMLLAGRRRRSSTMV